MIAKAKTEVGSLVEKAKSKFATSRDEMQEEAVDSIEVAKAFAQEKAAKLKESLS